MHIYIVSTESNNVLVPHNCEGLSTNAQFFAVALKLVIKLNQKALPANIEVSNAFADYLGIEIDGCRLQIKNTAYCVFIQGLTADDFDSHRGTADSQDDV